MIVSLLLLSGGVWVLTLVLGLRYPVLLGLVMISYGLGLRHAVDADHIAAIDNTTRKLLSEGKRPISVGLFFSLGHATVVIMLCMALALFSSFVQGHLPAVRTMGTFIGTIISSIFLFAIGLINGLTLIELVKNRNLVNSGKKLGHIHNQGGMLTKAFKPVLSTISQSWHMYPVGFLFGLGFDTASEIALLSISATTGASGLPIWTVILLPLAFTAGMALIDSLDGLLMLGAY
ncbi:MAG: HoxN/HupN/NixA family nickel/cobalt transporter, partial [Patescibacteria group bacterium]|nr:HoxN/HupN/NixA family nickel/cobalt transporter [Patescibacteria group bacterium]